MGKLDLSKPSILPGGFQQIIYPLEQFNLRLELINLLIEKKIIPQPVALEELHLYIEKEQQVADPNDGLNNISKLFYKTNQQFQHVYFKFIKYIAQNLLDFDFIFQETPTIRFHFPNCLSKSIHRSEDGIIIGHHNDPMLGHPFEEINCWLPLTQCYRTNTLQLVSLKDSIALLNHFCKDFDFQEEVYHSVGRAKFFDKLVLDENFREQVVRKTFPVVTKPGEIILFDSRCIHTPADNLENSSRISMDFRLIPLHVYETITRTYKSAGRSGRLFVRGDVFYSKSALEL
jgi:ectoine hydroxylase-related dioxygenase (phytanoyl-CoA dioxygenase family)